MASSETDYGLRAHSRTALSGIRSSSDSGTGIEGASDAAGGIGIDGRCDTNSGTVCGNAAQGTGVAGFSDTFIGVSGESTQFEGVRGTAHHKDHGAVVGKHLGGGWAVYGESSDGIGVVGVSTQSGVGVFGKGQRLAAQFVGNVDISGDLTIQGVSIQLWLQRIVALEQRVNNQQQQLIALGQNVSNLQQQLASLQQRRLRIVRMRSRAYKSWRGESLLLVGRTRVSSPMSEAGGRGKVRVLRSSVTACFPAGNRASRPIPRCSAVMHPCYAPKSADARRAGRPWTPSCPTTGR